MIDDFAPYPSEEETAEPIVPTDPIPSLPDEVLLRRARQADFALDESPGTDAIVTDLKNGAEPNLRLTMASQEDIKIQQGMLNKIKEVAASGVPVTDETVQTLMNAASAPKQNPDTVIEDKFSEKMVNFALVGNPGKSLVFQSAFDADAEGTRKNVSVAKNLLSRKQQAQGFMEELNERWKGLSVWGDPDGAPEQAGKAEGYLKMFLPGYQWVAMHDMIKSDPMGTILPGSNQLRQIQYLYLLPQDQFLPTLKKAVDEEFKTNPAGAMSFAAAAISMSTSDALIENAFGLFDVATALPIAKTAQMLRAWKTGGKVASEAVQSADNFIDYTQGFFTRGGDTDSLTPTPHATSTKKVPVSGEPEAFIPAERYYIPKAAAQKLEGIQVDKNNQPVFFTDMKNQVSVVPGREAKQGLIPVDVEIDGTVRFYPEVPPPTYYIPEAAAKKFDGMKVDDKGQPTFYTDMANDVSVVPGEKGPGMVPVQVTPPKTTFKTAKGSEYEVHEDGTTTRNKAPRDEHPGDFGEKPKSTETFYITEGEYEAYAKSRDRGDKSFPDKRGTTLYTDIANDVSIQGTKEPKVGLIPVEVWNDGKSRTLHFGNKIISVDRTKENVKFLPTIKREEEIQLRTAAADAVKAHQGLMPHPQDVLSKMGHHEDAATLGAMERVNQVLQKLTMQADPEFLRRMLPSIFSPQNYYHNSSVLSAERANRLAEAAIDDVGGIGRAILEPVRVERLTTEALSQAIDIAKASVYRKFNRHSDRIIGHEPFWDPATNTHFVETKIGHKDGTLFEKKTSAINTMHALNIKGATVKQEGSSFYIAHRTHVDETQSTVRQLMIVTGNETPQGWANTLLNSVSAQLLPSSWGGIRSSAYTVSKMQRDARNVATHAPQVLKNALEDAGGPIGNLAKSEKRELQRILEINRDTEINGVRGQFYRSAGEFETAFADVFQKLPTENQIRAYDAYTRLSDADWVLREMGWMRDKARLGIKNFRFSIEAIDEVGLPSNKTSDWFNGREVVNFTPENAQNANIYVADAGKVFDKYSLRDGKAGTLEREIMDKVNTGEYKILQLYNPKGKPLRDMIGYNDQIHFVVSKKFEDKPVKWGENSEYRPGGHVIYLDQYYLKIPEIGIGGGGKQQHFGDFTFKSFPTEKAAREWEMKYNTARDLLHRGDDAGYAAYVSRNLPETPNELKAMFAQNKLDTDLPFTVTHSGMDTIQSSDALATRFPGLRDAFSSYDLASGIDAAYLSERGHQLNTVARRGTDANPYYVNVASNLLDPYTSLQRGLNNAIRQRWMTDYKLQAAESWVQEFWTLFDQGKLPLDRLRQNPVYYLYHAAGNMDIMKSSASPALYAAAMTSRANIMRFVGTADEAGKVIDGYLSRKLIAGMDTIGGEKLAYKTQENFLPAIRDASSYVRAAVFHPKIGMFNPVQLFQQSQGLAHVLAVSPTNALQATTASALVRMFRYTEDPAILNRAADIAARLGWTKADFLEGIDAWKRAGVHHIGGEHAFLNTAPDYTILASGARKALDKSLFFFKAGESVVRDTAFFAAYREWKKANPGKAIKNRDINTIMARFDTLAMNMTRASNAGWNEGVLSFPTQFWTWNARFAEQMLSGKQLTLGERARAFAVYSTLYGIPATVGGIGFGVIPGLNYQDIRQYALKHNLPINDKWFQAFAEGLPSMLTTALTGYQLNIPERFGPNATQISDIIAGKKEGFDILYGASGGFIGDVLKSTMPFLTAIRAAFDQNSEFPLKVDDFVSVITDNVTSLSNGKKAYIAFTTGRFITKHGLYQDDISKFEAIMMGVLGLTPKDVQDAFSQLDFMKERKEGQKFWENLILEENKKAIDHFNRGEAKEGTDYLKRVKTMIALGNFTSKQESDLWKRATEGHESLIDSVSERWQRLKEFESIPELQKYLKLRNELKEQRGR